MEPLKKLLVPVARFCLRRGLKIQDLIEAAKAAFLLAAEVELKQGGSAVNVSRLAVITGLQRRDVNRLRSTDGRLAPPVNFLAKIIGQWSQDADFSAAGLPKTLAIEGANSEFVQLVRKVSKDVNPYTVLFELERLGAIKREGNCARLCRQVFEPTGDELQSLDLLASDMEDLSAAVEENIYRRAAIPNLHIKTQYDNICLEDLEAIRSWLLEQGSAFHARTRSFLSQFDKDLNPSLYQKQGGGRVVVGSFSCGGAAHEHVRKKKGQA